MNQPGGYNGYEPPPAGGFGGGAGNGNFGPMNPLPPNNGITPSTNLALAAMVCGIVSIPGIFICYSALPLGIAGVAMGVIARKRALRHPDLYGGKNFALWGIVTGAVGLALSVGFAAFYAILIFTLPH